MDCPFCNNKINMGNEHPICKLGHYVVEFEVNHNCSYPEILDGFDNSNCPRLNKK